MLRNTNYIECNQAMHLSGLRRFHAKQAVGKSWQRSLRLHQSGFCCLTDIPANNKIKEGESTLIDLPDYIVYVYKDTPLRANFLKEYSFLLC
jgi:hypothetical protein